LNKDNYGKSDTGLSEMEVIGNAFIFVLAGHDTAAGTLHFSLLLLSIDLSSQSHLQADIDNILGSRPSSSWSYPNDTDNLYNSMVGAVLNETLRLMPPIIQVNKTTRENPQQLQVDGRTITVPKNTFIDLEVVTTHRNPRNFPHRPSKVTTKPHDLDDFVPERWLLPKTTATGNAAAIGHPLETHLVDGLETNSSEARSSLFRPAKGAFIPFSEGARACPGKRFAQVELTAMIAVIFKQHSVELDVSAWASDQQVSVMSPREKKEVYAKAQRRAKELIRRSVPMVTLTMVGEKVPIRLVRRGRERFAGLGI
jgi:cytochrome P450